MDSATKLQNKLDKWEQKTDRYKASISRLEMKSQAIHDKQDKPLKSYTVVMYGSHDSITGENTVNFRLDSSVTTKSQYEKDKPRGLFHKLDAHIKTENIGFVVPVIKKDDNNPIGTNGAINTNASRRRIVLQNKALPTVLQDAVPYTKRTLLAAENAVIKAGDSFKHTAQPLAMAASNALKMQVSNEMYKSAQENTGLKATMGIANATVSTAQMIHKWSSNRRQYMVAQKGLKLEQKTELMKAKVEKLEMKSAMAKEKYAYKELRKSAKENGLDLKFTRAEKKKAWKKVFDSAQKGNYLEKPQMKSFQKASKADVLAAKEFKAAKQVYHTKLVKEKVFNTATGRTQTKYRRVIDKSRKKLQKPKKPDDFLVSASKMGLGALGNKAAMELANSDDVGTQAMGRGLQFGMSELSKANQKRAMQSKLKFDRKMAKAQMKMEKAHNELQIEKSKTEKPKLKKKDKKALKKAAAKKRNEKQFKETLKKKAKAVKDKAVAKAKDFVKKKMLPAMIGVGGAVVIILLIMIIPILFLGGNSNTGAILGVATYTTDREGLIEYNKAVNDLFWKWQSSINSKIDEYASGDTQEWLIKTNVCDGGPISNCVNISGSPYVEDTDNVYRVIKHLYGGEKCSFSYYDITCLYAYFTVKYKDDDWETVESEFDDFFDTYFYLDCKNDEKNQDIVKDESHNVLIDTHIKITCSDNHNHSTTGTPHFQDTLEQIYYYYLYDVDENNPMSIQKYIENELKSIGELNEDGVSEGELHYNMLMQSLGLHQVIDCAIYDVETGDAVNWSSLSRKSGTYGAIYNLNENSTEEGVLPDYRYKQTTQNTVNIQKVSDKLDIVAGGNGVIISKSFDSIEIEYPSEQLIITYSSLGGTAGMTSLTIGDDVTSGTHLFYSVSDGGMATVQLTAYCTETDEYINPLLVIKSSDN